MCAGIAAACLAPALGAAATGSASQKKKNGFRITLESADSAYVVTVSPDGASTVELEGGSQQHGAILRYQDKRLFLLDFSTQTFLEQGLGAALEARALEDGLAATAQPAGIPPISFDEQPPSVTETTLTHRIRGLRAQAYVLEAGGQTERDWFALDLPVPPADVAGELAAFDASSPGPLFRFQTGRLLLRREVLTAAGWDTILDTVKVKRVRVGTEDFAPADGWTPAGGGDRLPASRRNVPAVVQKPGNGPVSVNPRVFAAYWGIQFPLRPGFVARMNGALGAMGTASYSGALGQYGVQGGLLVGSGTVDASPAKGIGSAAIGLIADFVYGARYGLNGPKIWWRFGPDDPLYAVFVPESAVDAGWSAFHFLTITEAALVPFPANLAVHVMMPWTIAKVSDNDLNVGINPSSTIDGTSTLASHEYVEAVTDPIPLTAWYDPAKVPGWEQGEIADICELPSVLPWGEWTRVTPNGPRLATYWSNAAKACVPESRPTLSILAPAPNRMIRWHHPIELQAAGYDPVSGALPNLAVDVIWFIDGVQYAPQSVLGNLPQTPGNLALGPHVLLASVTVPNKPTNLTATASVNVTVFAEPPVVSIVSPAPGSAWGTDQFIPFNATAVDPQGDQLVYTWRIDGKVESNALVFQQKIAQLGDHTVTFRADDLSDGLFTTAGPITIHVVPATGLPSLQITSPPENFSADCVNSVHFHADASDGKGNLPDGAIAWHDDVVGDLGTGHDLFYLYNGCSGQLAPLPHTITATATNVNGSVSAQVHITVGIVG